jgi:hypothetical protein
MSEAIPALVRGETRFWVQTASGAQAYSPSRRGTARPGNDTEESNKDTAGAVEIYVNKGFEVAGTQYEKPRPTTTRSMRLDDEVR